MFQNIFMAFLEGFQSIYMYNEFNAEWLNEERGKSTYQKTMIEVDKIVKNSQFRIWESA